MGSGQKIKGNFKGRRPSFRRLAGYREGLDGGGFGVYNLLIAFSSEKLTAVAKATEGDIMASKILIAEDDANILGLLSVFLSGLGYEVSLARDGQEALEMAVQIKPDLVIVDIMMPRMNGFKLVNTLAMDRHDIPMPKVIMLTSLADKENVQGAFPSGRTCISPNRLIWKTWPHASVNF
jgi:CheY-like chemotaxis protein